MKNLHPIGTRIAKKFDEQIFNGEIISIDIKHKLYKVRYDDEDEEELTGRQISKYIHKDNTKKRTNDSNDSNNKTKKSRNK